MNPVRLLLRVTRRNSQHQDGFENVVDVALAVWLAAVAMLMAGLIVFAVFKLILVAVTP